MCVNIDFTNIKKKKSMPHLTIKEKKQIIQKEKTICLQLPLYLKREDGDLTEYLRVSDKEKITIVTKEHFSSEVSIITDHFSLLLTGNSKDPLAPYNKTLSVEEFDSVLKEALEYING